MYLVSSAVPCGKNVPAYMFDMFAASKLASERQLGNSVCAYVGMGRARHTPGHGLVASADFKCRLARFHEFKSGLNSRGVFVSNPHGGMWAHDVWPVVMTGDTRSGAMEELMRMMDAVKSEALALDCVIGMGVHIVESGKDGILLPHMHMLWASGDADRLEGVVSELAPVHDELWLAEHGVVMPELVRMPRGAMACRTQSGRR